MAEESWVSSARKSKGSELGIRCQLWIIMNLQPHALQALKSSIKSTECFQKSRGGAVLSFAGRQSVLQRWSGERARVHPLSGSSHSRSLCVSSQFGGDFLFFSSYTLYPPDTPVTWGWKTNLLINDSYTDPKPQLILNSKGPCVQLPRKAAVWEDQIRMRHYQSGKTPFTSSCFWLKGKS